MAIYRSIQMSFWTDPKIIDAFTPEDKYFYLYLMTNPHTNLCGCYEISERQIENETGYTKKVIEKQVDRMCKVHKVVDYCKDTKEVLITNWHKYNWTVSDKFRKPLEKEIRSVKNAVFKAYLTDLFNGIYTVSIPYVYGSDTTVTVTVTDNNNNTSNNNNSNNNNLYIYYPDDQIMNDYFMEYVAYRKEKRNPLTERSAKMAMKNLKEYATINGVFDREIAKKIIERSIANGWTGLFQLDDRQSGKPADSKPKQNKFEQGMITRGYDFSELGKEAFGS